MNKAAPALLIMCALILLGIVMGVLIQGNDVPLFDPKGLVAHEQYRLLIVSTLIMLGFGVPVIAALYFFAWKYRASNQKQTQMPDVKDNKAFLWFAWIGPLVIVVLLSAIMLPATQRLEPQKPIVADESQVTVQVVAMRWKWLFIYPEHNIATVNFAQIPVDTPVRFELTADEAPMASFWVPHLGGMLYAMTGHANPLHLMATTIGDYPGSSAELSGHGFADMKFTTRVSSKEDFATWVNDIQQSSERLNEAEYQRILEPSENNAPAYYSHPSPGLYSAVLSKYSGHEHDYERQGSY